MSKGLNTILGYILLIAIFGLVYWLTNKPVSQKVIEKPKSEIFRLFTDNVKDTVELNDSLQMILSVQLDTIFKKNIPKK